jgi:hypothetical protein
LKIAMMEQGNAKDEKKSAGQALFLAISKMY